MALVRAKPSTIQHGSPVDRPVKSSAYSRMVSRLVLLARLARAGLAPVFLAAFAALTALTLFAGCSSSSDVTNAGAAGMPSNRACTANAECDPNHGEFCVEGSCRLACRSHFDCQGECSSSTDTDGSSGHFCAPGQPQQSGQFYSRCPSGTDTDCDATSGFFCVSAGAQDLDAYCTKDCTDDSSCAAGFACMPLNRAQCAATCTHVAAEPKDHSCIPADQIGPGKPYHCGMRSVTRNACRPRKFCSTCQSDADCLASANQICAKDKSGANICTQLCDPKHPSCPWGSAATCGVWDQDLGVPTCAHRFGQCTGTGKSCEPCQQDADCGPSGACTSSSFTSERWCVDLTVTCSCGSDAGVCTGGGCPLSPSGLQLQCVDITPMTANSAVCNGANTSSGLLVASSQQTGCWPAK